jgi:hypothetical protein
MIFYLIKGYFRLILKNRSTVYWSFEKNEGFMLRKEEIIFFYNIIDFIDFFIFLANSKDKKLLILEPIV